MLKKIAVYCQVMVLVVTLAVIFTACKAKKTPEDTSASGPAADQPKDDEKSLIAAEIMAGHKALSQTATPQVAGSQEAQTAQEAVMPETMQGKVKLAKIPSEFPCKQGSDCTFTKFSNAPKSQSECTCAAPCTPYVVNKAEKERREEANHRLCDNEDWFGDACPAPTCGFIEFDSFECKEAKCVGMAVGE
ncbi:MAG: hypothetical protein ABH871_06605 [Pseudomonadota bacterium]